jgi:hypothetical protein
VARRVGDDEAPRGAGEEAIRHVDGDALLALRLESVEQEREVNPPALRAVLFRIRFERGQLIVENPLRLVEQPADERRLAVVDAAAGEET